MLMVVVVMDDSDDDDSDGYLVRWVYHVNIPNISSTLPCLLVAINFPFLSHSARVR